MTCDGLATSTILSEERLRLLLRNWDVIIWMAFARSSSKPNGAESASEVSF
jgi:hypothetical protein